MKPWALLLVGLMAATGFAQKAPPAAKNVAGDINAFAVDLYTRLDRTPGNLFFSPYSIESALGMAYVGARGNTAKQMAQTQHISDLDKPLSQSLRVLSSQLHEQSMAHGWQTYELECANGFWMQQGLSFNRDFVHILQRDFDATPCQVDFHSAVSAADEINQWVSSNTHGKIPTIIAPESVGPLTRLVLANAIYFKGKWLNEFPGTATSKQPFNLDYEHQVNVALMHDEPQGLSYMETDELQAVELPYVGNDLSMIVCLPRRIDGLTKLEQQWTDTNMRRWLEQMQPRRVEVYLPKFKTTTEIDLAKILATMGMKDAFDPAHADFSGIIGRRRLFISDVIHKTFVDVNEKGTEAAAATGIVCASSLRLMGLPPVVFRADHPFLFLIRDRNSGAILFMGRIVNPMN
ncbi:MAG TPA: serpin family protein [Tepidisphaeraceae bacterium]|nr:serpin family protein [Tepidisphaeraceae bacterium]